MYGRKAAIPTSRCPGFTEVRVIPFGVATLKLPIPGNLGSKEFSPSGFFECHSVSRKSDVGCGLTPLG